jgi:hypothetical protein
MASEGKLPRHAAGCRGRNANYSVRATSPEPLVQRRKHRTIHSKMRFCPYMVGTIVVFCLSFAVTRWLPDLMATPRHISEPTTGTLTSPSEETAQSLHALDNGPSVAPTPVIPIIIRRSTSSSEQVFELPPDNETSSQIAVPESVEAVAVPQQLDLRNIEDIKHVQRDTNAASTSDPGFIGRWGSNAAECRKSPLMITRRRAESSGATCEFQSTQPENLNRWRLQARCANDGERWNANIRFALSGSKLTWSSERGTTTYVRCPN